MDTNDYKAKIRPSVSTRNNDRIFTIVKLHYTRVNLKLRKI